VALGIVKLGPFVCRASLNRFWTEPNPTNRFVTGIGFVPVISPEPPVSHNQGSAPDNVDKYFPSRSYLGKVGYGFYERDVTVRKFSLCCLDMDKKSLGIHHLKGNSIPRTNINRRRMFTNIDAAVAECKQHVQ
jgi:hypothetical protein